MSYYTYVIFDPRDGYPLYVGKGKEERMYQHHEHNVYFHAKIQEIRALNLQPIYEKWFEHEDQFPCYWFEHQLIKYFGRRDLGTGTLCNLTDGGEHWVKGNKSKLGQKLSEKTRAKISAASSGSKNGMWGKPAAVGSAFANPIFWIGRKHKAESRLKISAANKGRPAHNKGKPMSEEQKAKLHAASTGQIPWNKGKIGYKINTDKA